MEGARRGAGKESGDLGLKDEKIRGNKGVERERETVCVCV